MRLVERKKINGSNQRKHLTDMSDPTVSSLYRFPYRYQRNLMPDQK